MSELKAPYPWMGGKSAVADLVWSRLGDVDNFIEPLAGSIAVLLRRPAHHAGQVETISDINHYVVNFWRAVIRDSKAVAFHADNPVIEADLHARHHWLELSAEAAEHKDKIVADPEYFDARIAGWWAWGQSTWIGGGWCQDHGKKANGDTKGQLPELEHNRGINRKRSCEDKTLPDLGSARGLHSKRVRLAAYDQPGTGVNAPERVSDPKRRPVLSSKISVNSGRPQLGDAYDIGRGVNSNKRSATCAARLDFLEGWIGALADRLRLVRVCYGHWGRICSSKTTTTRLGLTGVFLDPPYPTHRDDGTQSRDGSLYHGDDRTTLDALRDEVLEWCKANGLHPKMRIAVCGYDTDGYAALESLGWTVEHWKAGGGYGNMSGADNANAKRERIWFSPACLTNGGLFG